VKVSKIIVQGRCVSNKKALNDGLIQGFFIKIYPGTHGVLQHFDSNLCTFSSFLLTASRRIQKGAGFNKRAGTIVSFKLINV
jgi:hypothetical protein